MSAESRDSGKPKEQWAFLSPNSGMNADEELRQMLKDLLWLNSLIATELIQLTENSSAILRDGNIPESCLAEHAQLRAVALDIADRYLPGTELRKHVEKHQ